MRENGQVFLQDVMTGNNLCEVTLPSGFCVRTPWDPALTAAANGDMLYIKGTNISQQL